MKVCRYPIFISRELKLLVLPFQEHLFPQGKKKIKEAVDKKQAVSSISPLIGGTELHC